MADQGLIKGKIKVLIKGQIKGLVYMQSQWIKMYNVQKS